MSVKDIDVKISYTELFQEHDVKIYKKDLFQESRESRASMGSPPGRARSDVSLQLSIQLKERRTPWTEQKS